MGDCIHKRTVFYDTAGGVVRPRDWAAVINGSEGTLWEPRCGFFPDVPNGAQVDFTDEILRVDEMLQVDGDRMTQIMSNFDGMALMGGDLTLRTGR